MPDHPLFRSPSHLHHCLPFPFTILPLLCFIRCFHFGHLFRDPEIMNKWRYLLGPVPSPMGGQIGGTAEHLKRDEWTCHKSVRILGHLAKFSPEMNSSDHFPPPPKCSFFLPFIPFSPPPLPPHLHPSSLFFPSSSSSLPCPSLYSLSPPASPFLPQILR